ncbi:hypothetical protein G3N95_01580 [Paraburkholderia sp. Tr-20389]|uniref:hypothetical protein n=1 Tax=Paraburkholderia sp. Tr-20389 TaxID=2703903 RepID=UPI0019823738|nr:hypothetical protein [Paraburkholderia sp. Tr-20389]MBN3751614.1 hypothetical protein [Paraburkholderia sp. Tr-20389]
MTNGQVPYRCIAVDDNRMRGFFWAVAFGIVQVIALCCAALFWSWQAGFGLRMDWGFLFGQRPLQIAACLIVLAPIAIASRRMARSSIRKRNVFIVTQVVFWLLIVLTALIDFVMGLMSALSLAGHS